MSACIDCVAGRYVEGVGSASLEDCIMCVAGMYAETMGNAAELAVAESCTAQVGSSVFSDTELLSFMDVVAAVAGNGTTVDAGYRNLTVDECQSVCEGVDECAAAMWLHCCPSHCVLLSACSELVGWDVSQWSEQLGLIYESSDVSVYGEVASGDAAGLVTWVKAEGVSTLDSACVDPSIAGSVDGSQQRRAVLRSACRAEFDACEEDVACSAELEGVVSTVDGPVVEPVSTGLSVLMDCFSASGGRRVQGAPCGSLSDAESCASAGCVWDGASCAPDCSFTPGVPSTCGDGCVYTDRVDGCMDCVAGKYATAVGSASVGNCIDCIAGQYAETAGNDNATDCIDCAAGQYVPTSGSAHVTDCIDCVAGTYVEVTGSDAASDCIACVAGTYEESSGRRRAALRRWMSGPAGRLRMRGIWILMGAEQRAAHLNRRLRRESDRAPAGKSEEGRARRPQKI